MVHFLTHMLTDMTHTTFDSDTHTMYDEDIRFDCFTFLLSYSFVTTCCLTICRF